MTNQEAIQELAGMYRVIVTDCLTSTIEAENKNMAIDMAIAALEAQEPKSILVKKNAYGWPFWKCPKCGREFVTPVHFCDKCGQAVKWE